MGMGLSIPFGAIAKHETSGNVAAATATATLAADANRFNWLTGFTLTGLGATGATNVDLTITGLNGGNTMRYNVAVPAGATTAITPLDVRFPVPLKASGKNVAIVVSVPTFGAGNTKVCVNAYGYACED